MPSSSVPFRISISYLYLLYRFRAIKDKERLWRELMLQSNGILVNSRECMEPSHPLVHTRPENVFHSTFFFNKSLSTLFPDKSLWRSLGTKMEISRSTVRSEETQDSHSVKWTLSLLKRLMNISEFSMTSKVDSNPIELTPRKLDSSFAKSPKKLLASQRYHTSSLMMEEQSDSHTLISKSTTQSR